ncbi:hypothetical protein KCP73_09030 [Salmonella enterica subsp. enterica]|nr:hypothetical protein KCP73_09030 [Salmonella enterica subsp. enterica]
MATNMPIWKKGTAAKITPAHDLTTMKPGNVTVDDQYPDLYATFAKARKCSIPKVKSSTFIPARFRLIPEAGTLCCP